MTTYLRAMRLPNIPTSDELRHTPKTYRTYQAREPTRITTAAATERLHHDNTLSVGSVL